MQPLTAPAAPTSEDIDAVLGRFQAWSVSHRAKENTRPRAKDLPEGVRELSYEEALESSRSRWQSRSQPSVSDELTEEVQTSPEEESIPAISTAINQDQREDKHAPSAFDSDAILPDRLNLSMVANPPTKAMNPVERPAAAFGAILAETLPAEPDPGVLALVWPASPKNERQVSISLRVAASEQALIKARAAEAGLSVSAYLRQCALEVEKLRAQVHHTLALLEQQRSEQSAIRSLSGPPPETAASGGFLAWLGRRIFGTPTRLTLRT